MNPVGNSPLITTEVENVRHLLSQHPLQLRREPVTKAQPSRGPDFCLRPLRLRNELRIILQQRDPSGRTGLGGGSGLSRS